MPRFSSTTPSSQLSGESCGVTLHPQETYPWVRQLVAWLLRKQQCEVMTSMLFLGGQDTAHPRYGEAYAGIITGDGWFFSIISVLLGIMVGEEKARLSGASLPRCKSRTSLKQQCLWVFCLHLFVKRSQHHWEMNSGAFNMTCDVQVVLDFSLASQGALPPATFPGEL